MSIRLQRTVFSWHQVARHPCVVSVQCQYHSVRYFRRKTSEGAASSMSTRDHRCEFISSGKTELKITSSSLWLPVVFSSSSRLPVQRITVACVATRVDVGTRSKQLLIISTQ